MSEALERAENMIRLSQQTTNPAWSTAHSLTAIAILLKEYFVGRP